jgi:hypothetical protein
MVIASLSGYAVASQFITLYGIEAPYYVVLIGAGLLKLQHMGVRDADQAAETEVRTAPALPGVSQSFVPNRVRPRAMTVPGVRD